MKKIINRDWSDFLSVRQTSMRRTRCMHVYIQHLDCTLKGNKPEIAHVKLFQKHFMVFQYWFQFVQTTMKLIYNCLFIYNKLFYTNCIYKIYLFLDQKYRFPRKYPYFWRHNDVIFWFWFNSRVWWQTKKWPYFKLSDLFWDKPISRPIYGFRKKQTVQQYFEPIIFLFEIILNLTANHLPNPKPFFRCGKSHYFWNSCFKPFYHGSDRYKPVSLYVQAYGEIHMSSI